MYEYNLHSIVKKKTGVWPTLNSKKYVLLADKSLETMWV